MFEGKKIKQKVIVLLVIAVSLIGLFVFGPWIMVIAPIIFLPVLLIAILYIIGMCVSLVVNHVLRRKRGQKHLFRDTDVSHDLSDRDSRIDDRDNGDGTRETYIRVDRDIERKPFPRNTFP